DLENSSLSKKSNKLFTLSSIKHANRALLKKKRKDKLTESDVEIAKAFWTQLSQALPFWKLVREGKIAASSVREDNLFSHGIIIQAIATLGSYLLSQHPENWQNYVKQLEDVNWSKSNHLWDGRSIIFGRMTKTKSANLLTVNALKLHLGIELDPEEKVLEDSFNNDK
ncbi:DNA sulfur modification protein DndB, partial [Oleiphilus sp. HI0117]